MSLFLLPVSMSVSLNSFTFKPSIVDKKVFKNVNDMQTEYIYFFLFGKQLYTEFKKRFSVPYLLFRKC